MSTPAETALPASMTVIAISEPGRPDVLQPETRPLPHPFEHEILIQVAAAGVNRPDVVQRQGHYPPPKGASGTETPMPLMARLPTSSRSDTARMARAESVNR